MDNLLILLDEMDQLIQSSSPINVTVRRKDISKFLEITGENPEFYFQNQQEIITPNYFMSLLAPIGTKIMIKILEHKEFQKMVGGIVHSQSEIKFKKPLKIGKFQVWSHIERLQKKKGKMGNYLVLTFRMSLMDENEEEVAWDKHQFFLRLKEDAI
ncbi:MAG: FAS1-like dehydratase domain-containing protein [Candidatus Helarchaeota archaeon]